MSVDILGTSCDQCWSMVQYSFTSTETRRLDRTDNPGQPPRLSHSSWTMSVRIKMECLLYLEKIWHWWPRIWNKRRICNRIGKAALPCPCMNREACCLQLSQLTGANWNHTLVSGFTWKRRLPHPLTSLRPSTNELLTELKTFSSFQLQNLQRPFHQQSD